MTNDEEATNPTVDRTSPVPARFDRRTLVRRGGALGAGIAGAGTLARLGFAQDDATPAASLGTTTDVIASIVAAANAFLDTLSDSEREAVLFDWSDTEQKQRWSNFPEGLFERDGLMWGDLDDASREAWLGLMQATLSQDGYNRVLAEWNADDALASSDEGNGGGATPGGDASGTPSGGDPLGSGTPPVGAGVGPGGGTPPSGGAGGMQMLYGMEYYWVALIGEPSESDPWQWQWGGHHVTVNATVGGGNVALTPSFIGVQPATYTDESGNTVCPLGDIEDDAFALVNALDADQRAAAVLGDASIDLVLGPGEDGRTLQPEGLPASEMTEDQRAMLVQLIGHYTGLVAEDLAAQRLEEVTDVLDETCLAWYGPTTQGSAAYFRVAGPTIVIEYSPQSMGGDAAEHIHGIYRDPSNDYGAKYTA